ncbi:type II toxin-antitoxin system RelE/ParE family toxin [Mesorhizobium sp. M0991]
MDRWAGKRSVRAVRHRGDNTESSRPVRQRHQQPAEWLTSRSLTIDNYLVLYRLAEQRVETVRVVHGARDVSALF